MYMRSHAHTFISMLNKKNPFNIINSLKQINTVCTHTPCQSLFFFQIIWMQHFSSLKFTPFFEHKLEQEITQFPGSKTSHLYTLYTQSTALPKVWNWSDLNTFTEVVTWLQRALLTKSRSDAQLNFLITKNIGQWYKF